LELIIHAGLDKCGSTAIQGHLNIYRNWFLAQGVYIPRTGLTGLGHYSLFQDMSAAQWQQLNAELQEASTFSRAVISFEGIHFLSSEKLQFVQQQLATHRLNFLFYLREQSQIFQSGYLQKLKRGKQVEAMATFRHDRSLLTPTSRDYRAMLERFASVFTGAAFHARIYNRRSLMGGNIVLDILDFLDLTPDKKFVPARELQNVSLDVQAAEILNVYDSVSDDAGGREVLVEDLLLLIGHHGAGKKWFLDDTATRYIKEHYAASNRWLWTQYGVDLTTSIPVNPADLAEQAADGSEPSVKYLAKLAELARFSRWSGDRLAGPSLAELLQHNSGWSAAVGRGAWSLGDTSWISFRIPKSRSIGADKPYRVNIQGRYFGDNVTTGLKVNGAPMGEWDLRDSVFEVPPGVPDRDQVIELELTHTVPISPAALDMGADERQIAYCLEAISCCREG
jgi:hypothetical protein